MMVMEQVTERLQSGLVGVDEMIRSLRERIRSLEAQLLERERSTITSLSPQVGPHDCLLISIPMVQYPMLTQTNFRGNFNRKQVTYVAR